MGVTDGTASEQNCIRRRRLSLLPVLDHATVIKITGRGIVITGLELLPSGRKGPIDRCKQTWWCEMAGG